MQSTNPNPPQGNDKQASNPVPDPAIEAWLQSCRLGYSLARRLWENKQIGPPEGVARNVNQVESPAVPETTTSTPKPEVTNSTAPTIAQAPPASPVPAAESNQEKIRKVTMSAQQIKFATIRITPNPDGKHLEMQVIPNLDVSNPEYMRDQFLPIVRTAFSNGSRTGQQRPEATLPNQLYCLQGELGFVEACWDAFDRDWDKVDVGTASLVSQVIDECISIHLPKVSQNLHSFMLRLDPIIEKAAREKTQDDVEDLDAMELLPPPVSLGAAETPLPQVSTAESFEKASATPPPTPPPTLAAVVIPPPPTPRRSVIERPGLATLSETIAQRTRLQAETTGVQPKP